MDQEHKNNYILNLFIIALTFLFLMVYDFDFYGPINFFNASNLTHIELLVQSNSPNNLQFNKVASSRNNQKEYASFNLENKSKKRLLRLADHFLKKNFHIQQQYYPPPHYIISILQKNNTWHQSADDDPSAMTFVSHPC